MGWLAGAAVTGVIVLALASANEVTFSTAAFEQRIIQEVGARMEQFGQQYLSRIEQLQVGTARTLTRVEDKLGQLQERARVWDTFQSVITSWTDLLVGTDRKMDLLKEGIDRTVELYEDITPYSAVSYAVDQLNAQLARLVAKIPESSGAMVNDFAIKGVMATLRELKTKIEGMNRRRFVIKKVVNSVESEPGVVSAGPGADIQYRDIQDELEEAISSNNMLNAIEVKLDRIAAVVTERRPPEVHAARRRNSTESVLRQARPRVHGEPRGRRRPPPGRPPPTSAAAAAAGVDSSDAPSCDKLLKQWTQMELNFDQFESVREAVGRMEDVLDYRTSTMEVKLDRLEDVLFRQGSKQDKSDLSLQRHQEDVVARLKTIRQAGSETVEAFRNVSDTTAALAAGLGQHRERTEQRQANISRLLAELHDHGRQAATNSSQALQALTEAVNSTAVTTMDRLFAALDLLAKPAAGAEAATGTAAAGGHQAAGAGAAPTQQPPPPGPGLPGLRGCEDLAELGMESDVRYRFGDAFGPPVGLDFMERYCDMDTDDGGWTVIQRRNDFGTPKLNFSQTWNAYKHGFGDLDKEFWFGNENIHKLTHDQDVTLRVDLEDFDGNTAYAIYTKFKVSGEDDGYYLEVAGYHGNASDSLTSHNLSKFSTWDVTNDKAPPCCPCANAYGGGWWFNSCFESNLNGEYHTRPRDNDHYHGIIWELWKGDYSLKSSEMKVRAMSYVREPALADGSGGTAPPSPPPADPAGPSGQLGVGTTSGPAPTAAEPPVTEAAPPDVSTPVDLGVEPLNA
ncbi:uncharacterized protein LOC122380093 [Amphibalanus amphitrite]|uniref:uncharacterized protein LOC122380093 n=1 Tax=Amphibalanus amphitrite TaxID=1232801 RepID=UPI001C9219C1|nr:uncharacterized protein LOC122380093 [Amphibalanus amphitrite]